MEHASTRKIRGKLLHVPGRGPNKLLKRNAEIDIPVPPAESDPSEVCSASEYTSSESHQANHSSLPRDLRSDFEKFRPIFQTSVVGMSWAMLSAAVGITTCVSP